MDEIVKTGWVLGRPDQQAAMAGQEENRRRGDAHEAQTHEDPAAKTGETGGTGTKLPSHANQHTADFVSLSLSLAADLLLRSNEQQQTRSFSLHDLLELLCQLATEGRGRKGLEESGGNRGAARRYRRLLGELYARAIGINGQVL